jgi:hypothetical protein
VPDDDFDQFRSGPALLGCLITQPGCAPGGMWRV